MKIWLRSLAPLLAGGWLAGCMLVKPAPPDGTFDSVRPILERNCLHCHGLQKLPYMPSLGSTADISKLMGPGKWIMPGKPGDSRLYQVVVAGDSTPGAMPPTGHAIQPSEVEAIRLWIKAGAPLPKGESVTLTPRGEAIRSR